MADVRWGFDVGNSCVKAALLRRERPLLAELTVHSSVDRLSRWLDQLLAKDPCRKAVISTVSPPASDRLTQLLLERKIDVDRVFVSDGGIFATGALRHQLQTPETTGVDRALSAIAALDRAPGKPVIVVDCGSAVTVNLTTADRVFRGGAILPGWRLMGFALHRGTAALPEVSPSTIPAPIGASTKDAIAAGVYHAVVGAIERLVGDIADSLDAASEPSVFLTGGDAPLVSPRLRVAHALTPNLVLEGLELVTRSSAK